MRQFGLPQHIPDPCDTMESLHAVDRRGRGNTNWLSTHIDHVLLWNSRADHIVIQRTDAPDATEIYMAWYGSITRRRIGPPTQLPPQPPPMQYEPLGSRTHALVNTMIAVVKRCATALRHNIDDYARAAF